MEEIKNLDHIDKLNDKFLKIKNLPPEIISSPEKFCILGLMSKHITHELNNSIQGIMLLIDLLKMNYPDDENINTIDQEIQKIKHLTRSALHYLKSNTIEFSNINLSILMKASFNLADNMMEESLVKVKVKYPQSEIWVIGNFFYLQQAFLNLIFLSDNQVKLSDTSSGVINVTISDHKLSNKIKVQIKQPNLISGYENNSKLEVAKKIFHLHEGELDIIHNYKGKSIFTVTLPVSSPL